MANLQWNKTVETEGAFVNPWYFSWTGPSPTGNEQFDAQLLEQAKALPRLGLWVSGQVREAECVNFPMGSASDWLTDLLEGQQHYTDLIFKYTVQPGDLALPLLLANASGTGPADGSNPEGYYLKNNGQPTQWAISGVGTGGVVQAEFAFGPSNIMADPRRSRTTKRASG